MTEPILLGASWYDGVLENPSEVPAGPRRAGVSRLGRTGYLEEKMGSTEVQKKGTQMESVGKG